jgi:hypothetical protein
MADTKLSAMTENTSPAGTDLLYLLDNPGGGGTDNKLELETLRDWMRTEGVGAFPIQAGSFNNSPSASTTYYYGGVFGGTWGTTAGARILYVGKACILKAVYTVLTYSGTAANNTALYFRLNNTTDTTLSTTIALGGSPTVVSATGLSTAVAAGDYFEMKIVFGASTVPSAVSVSSILWFDES